MISIYNLSGNEELYLIGKIVEFAVENNKDLYTIKLEETTKLF